MPGRSPAGHQANNRLSTLPLDPVALDAHHHHQDAVDRWSTTTTWISSPRPLSVVNLVPVLLSAPRCHCPAPHVSATSIHPRLPAHARLAFACLARARRGLLRPPLSAYAPAWASAVGRPRPLPSLTRAHPHAHYPRERVISFLSMAISHASYVGSNFGEQPHGSAPLPATFPPPTSSPVPTTTSPLPISTAPPATAPLNLIVSPLGAAFSDGASSSTAQPPSIHAVNIGAHIDFKLDPISGNYSKWRRIMSFILSMSGLESHVLVHSEPLQQTAQWRHDDLQILIMIYSTITDELYDVISAKDTTAYHAWVLIDAFSLDNLAVRAVHIGATFWSRATTGTVSTAGASRRSPTSSTTLTSMSPTRL
nr:predicted protein [Triticum aestivum]